MKITSDQKNILTVAAVGAVGLFALGRLAGNAYKKAEQEVKTTFNPGSDQNLVYSGVNAVGDVFDNGSNDDSFSLGVWIYDVFHPNENFNNTIPPASQVSQ